MELNQKKLELAMAKKKWGPGDLAAALNMTTRGLHRIRTSLNMEPQTLGKIAEALEVDPEEIVA